MQPRQDWDGYNDTGPLDCPTQGHILAQSSHLEKIRRKWGSSKPQPAVVHCNILLPVCRPLLAIACDGVGCARLQNARQFSVSCLLTSSAASPEIGVVVEVAPDIGVSAKTVGELRKVTAWAENLVVSTPQERHPESAVKVSKASVATRVSPKP